MVPGELPAKNRTIVRQTPEGEMLYKDGKRSPPQAEPSARVRSPAHSPMAEASASPEVPGDSTASDQALLRAKFSKLLSGSQRLGE
ncbi:hypothetical protein H920_07727 [Fukomys damarensis]|uniref:Uncharacterized protein n=1 Tax=Fukomys damarensis TaxID=885580 RepID=A0A091DFB8_FUKDA|nr:hypothetical protein H920_07727 [Fukomys damarensis]